MTTASDFLAKTSVQDNLLERIDLLRREVELLKQRDTNAANLAEISDDAGDLRSGRFLALVSGYNPTDADATGVFLSADGEDFGGETYNIGGVQAGGLQFGMRNSDGAGVFAGGDATIGADGITIDKMGYLIEHTATDGTTERTGSMGMWAEEGGTEPCYGFRMSEPADETDILDGTNAGFETGDFTGWTKTTETVGSWVILAKPVCLWNIFEGSYMAFFERTTTTSSAITGVLTKDRDAVTENTKYLLHFGLEVSGMPGVKYGKVEINWYNHASAGTLIRTDLLAYVTTSYYPNLTSFSPRIKSPAGALSCEIVLTAYSSAKTGNMLSVAFDGFTMNEVSIESSLYLNSDGYVEVSGLPVFADSYAGYFNQFRGYLADGTEVIPATDRVDSANTLSGLAKKWTGSEFTGNGAYVKCSIPLAPGTYTCRINNTKGPQDGKVDLYMDGVKQTSSPVDWYGSTAVYNNETDITGITVVGEGVHELMLKINGKNASSSGYGMGGSVFCFIRTA